MKFWLSVSDCNYDGLLARDVFVSTNRRAIVMMFVSPSVRLSVCLWMYKLGEALNANNDRP